MKTTYIFYIIIREVFDELLAKYICFYNMVEIRLPKIYSNFLKIPRLCSNIVKIFLGDSVYSVHFTVYRI